MLRALSLSLSVIGESVLEARSEPAVAVTWRVVTAPRAAFIEASNKITDGNFIIEER